MQVPNAVEGVLAHVHHQAVAPFPDALPAGHLLGGGEHLGQETAMLGAHFGGVGEVVAGDDEHVDGSGRIDVAKGVGVLGGQNFVGGGVAGHHLAEQAVRHGPETLVSVQVEDMPAEDVDAFLDDLARWTADTRTDEAARSRTRERWLRQQATEAARFTGVALDLAERGVAVAVGTTTARTLHGHIVAVARDFLVLRHDSGTSTFLALVAVATIRPEAGHRAGDAASDRTSPVDTVLADVFAALAADRPRVRVVVEGGGEVLAGELRAASGDVVTLRLDSEAAATIYLQLASVRELTLLD